MERIINACGGKNCCPKLEIRDSNHGCDCTNEKCCENKDNVISVTDDYFGKVCMTKEQAIELAKTILKEVE